MRAIHQYSIHDATAKRGSCQDGDGRSGLHTCYAAQLPTAKRSTDEAASTPEQRRGVEISCGEDVPAVKIRHAIVVPSVSPIIRVCGQRAGSGHRFRPRITDLSLEFPLPLLSITLQPL